MSGRIEPLPDPDVETVEGMKKAVRTIADRVNDLVKRGDGDDKEENAKVIQQIADLSARIDKAEKKAPLPPAGQSNLTLDALEVPDDYKGMNRMHYNMTAVPAMDLVGLRSIYGPKSKLPELSEGNSNIVSDINEFQRLNDELLITNTIMWGSGNTSRASAYRNRSESMKALRGWPRYARLAEQFQRVGLTTTGSATGAEWIPTILSANMFDIVQAELRVASLFPQITMTSKIMESPIVAGDSAAYLVLEAAGEPEGAETTPKAPAASRPATGKMTLTAVKLMSRVYASNEVLEDSIIAMMPFITSNMAKVLARGVEDAIINGDSVTTFMDGATFNPAGGVRRAWNGLRQICYETGSYPAVVDGGGASVTTAKLAALLGTQGIYGAVVGEGAWIGGFQALSNLLKLGEFLTLEKYGNAATILTGEMGRVFGRPFILSEFVTNMQATGKYGDGTGETFGQLLHVYRSGFALGQRRAVDIKADPYTGMVNDQTVVVGSWRGDFKPVHAASATVAPVGVIYNLIA